MKYLTTGGFALLVMGSAAHAGGIERTDQSVGILFQQGRYVEFTASYIMPDVDGVGPSATGVPGQNSGNIGRDINNVGVAFKDDINKSWSYALIYDEPYGTDVKYNSGTGYFAQGTAAKVVARALTGILQYNIAEPGSALGGQFSVYGGPRAQFIRASSEAPLRAYTVRGEGEFGLGYLVGAAWERPDLGMRVSLTYTSEIKHSLDTLETQGATTRFSESSIDTPEALNLEFQTGVTPTTLLFGSVRWVPWSQFVVNPPLFAQISPAFPLAFFEDDRITYNLGIGQAITKNVSVFGILGYEAETGSRTGGLNPADGFIRYTLGTTIKHDRARLTIAGRYTDVGDATTVPTGGVLVGEFTDNSAWATSVKLGFDLN